MWGLALAGVLSGAVAPFAVPAQEVGAEAGTGGATPLWVRWGWQRTELVRYNRVEGLSAGVRAQAYPTTAVGAVTVGATLRLGTADRTADVRFDVAGETTRRRLALAVYRELAAVEEGARHLGLANSATALLIGRDDGDYYRRTGVAVEWTPPSARRPSLLVRAHAERHASVGASSRFAVVHLGDYAWRFRPNLEADEGWDVGGVVALSPMLGTDPLGPQARLDGMLRVGVGRWSYRGASLGGAVRFPLTLRTRLETEAGGGVVWGELPQQRLFAVGGPATLRGFDPRVLTGRTFLRGRAGLSRQWPLGVVRAFADAAWAGSRGGFALDRVLASAGLGAAIVDGRIHGDVAWVLRGASGRRWEFYLDATP